VVNTCPTYQKKRYRQVIRKTRFIAIGFSLIIKVNTVPPCGIEVIFEYIARLFSKALWGKMGRSIPVAVLFSAKGFGIYGVL